MSNQGFDEVAYIRTGLSNIIYGIWTFMCLLTCFTC